MSAPQLQDQGAAVSLCNNSVRPSSAAAIDLGREGK